MNNSQEQLIFIIQFFGLLISVLLILVSYISIREILARKKLAKRFEEFQLIQVAKDLIRLGKGKENKK